MLKPRAARVVSIILLLSLAAGALVVYLSEAQLRAEQRAALTEIGRGEAARLQHQLDSAFSAVYALATVAEQSGGDVVGFASLSAELTRGLPMISSLELAPGATVAHVFPLTGNEDVLGHDMLADPDERADALRAIESRALTVAGPFELRQGGLGIAGRLAIFTGARRETFWGLATAVIRVPALLDTSGLHELGAAGYDYELARIEPATGARAVFAASGDAPLSSPITFDITVPNGHWSLAVAQRDDWAGPGWLALKIAAAVLFSLLATFLASSSAAHRQQLEHEVELATSELTDANRRLKAEAAERASLVEALRTSEERLRTVVTNAPIIQFSLDAAGAFTLSEGRGLETIGRAAGEVVGRSIFEVYRDVPAIQSNIRRAMAGEVVTSTVQLGAHWFDTWQMPLHGPGGGVAGVTGIAINVTGRERAEQALREANESLELRVAERTSMLRQLNEQLHHELAERRQVELTLESERSRLAQYVAERTAELSTANAELARVARLKDEFLASMSHELRTPLNAILGLSEALQRNVYGELNAKQSASLRTIAESGNHLLALINDILDLSKIEAGKLVLTIDAVAVPMVCQASVRMVKQAAHAKKIGISLAIDPQAASVRADARRLKQMLVNLLSNAVKFTPDGGQVGLDVVPDPSNHTIRFTVWDSGIGIAPDQLGRLFRPFVQLDGGLARQFEGTGLGLSLVYRMARLHGGSVALTSSLGSGSRFSIMLPWGEAVPDAEAHAPPAAPPVSEAAPRPGRGAEAPLILLAEDQEANIGFVTDFLHSCGYRVLAMRNGRDVTRAVRSTRPQAVLMDIQMPGVDGLTLIRELRGAEETAGLPIIALTALAMPGDRERCLEAGADRYISKPVSLRTLQEAIESVGASRAPRHQTVAEQAAREEVVWTSSARS